MKKSLKKIFEPKSDPKKFSIDEIPATNSTNYNFNYAEFCKVSVFRTKETFKIEFGYVNWNDKDNPIAVHIDGIIMTRETAKELADLLIKACE